MTASVVLEPQSQPTKMDEQLMLKQRMMARRRKRCKSWNVNSTISVDEDSGRGLNEINGDAFLCFTRDGSFFEVNYKQIFKSKNWIDIWYFAG